MVSKKKRCIQSLALTLLLSLLWACDSATQSEVTPAERLQARIAVGEKIFNDSNMSEPAVIACTSCHNPDSAYADPRGGYVSEGSIPGFVGKRNAPSLVYAEMIPGRSTVMDNGVEQYFGGLFLDGRVNSVVAAARTPVNSHLSAYDNGDETVASGVRNAGYASQFLFAYGRDAFNRPDHPVEHMGDAIGEFLRSTKIERFTSRYDQHLAGDSDFTAQESLGLALFSDPDKGNCASCHKTTISSGSGRVMLTNYQYYNTGIPKNENSPFLDMPARVNAAGRAFVDLGLYESTGRDIDKGRFRVPTLRNVAVTAPYGHNGYFTSLEDIVHFYNVKNSGSFGSPEVSANEERTVIGALNLTPDEEMAIVAFLRTLTDGVGQN